MKTISKFRVRQKLQVISKLGERHVVLGQKHKSVADRFFIVRDDFEHVLQDSSSIPVDAEIQRDTETGRVSFVHHSDEQLSLNDLASNLSLNYSASINC